MLLRYLGIDQFMIIKSKGYYVLLHCVNLNNINNKKVFKKMCISPIQSQYSSQINTSIINFIPLDKIGEGSFSSVYKVRRITDDQIYALKKIKIASLKQKQKQNALNQIRILASLNSEYIIQYRQAFFDHKLNLLCIVMEFANEGDLQKKIQSYRRFMKHIPENEVWKAAYNTIKGLDLLHTRSILHRDIKSANIFIGNGAYKLGDLNVSKVQDNVNKLAYTQTGTPYYASPQVWRDQPYDSKSDIWSLGCVLYQMCTYRPPFRGKDLETLYQNVQRGLYDPLPLQYSQQIGKLISYCLKLNPKHRLSCKQLLSLKIMKQKIQKYNLSNQEEDMNEQLLKTIKLPTDLRDLKKKLPKSKYSCSIDSLSFKKEKKQSMKNESQINIKEIIEPIKKFSHADHYLQLAKKKKQTQNYYSKINRVISQGSIGKNPEQMIQSPQKTKQSQEKLKINLNYHTNDQKNIKLSIQKYKINELISQRKETPISDRMQKGFTKKQEREQSINPKQKYHISFDKDKANQDLKIRKLSHDQEKNNSGKIILNHISLLKKLSQPGVNKCLSQRNFEENLKVQRLKNQFETQRLINEEKMIKNLAISKRNEQLAQIEKKVDEKRKQLRKIGSIQRLQASNSKNMHNLSYRPPAPLVINPHIKKTGNHMSNILLKSPTSTEDESSNRNKQKLSSRKLISSPQVNKVSSTPYMVGLSDAPRMKRMLQNVQEGKKSRQLELKTKILSSRYLHKY